MTPKAWADKAVEKLLDYPEQQWVEQPRDEVARVIRFIVRAALKEDRAGRR